jgi:hypothetical protein
MRPKSTPEEFVRKYFPHAAECDCYLDFSDALADLETDMRYLEQALFVLTTEVRARL